MNVHDVSSLSAYAPPPPPPPPPEPEPVNEAANSISPSASQDASSISSGSGGASSLNLEGLTGDLSDNQELINGILNGDDLDSLLRMLGEDPPIPEETESSDSSHETSFNDEQLKSIYDNYQILRNDPEKLLEAMTEFNVSAQDIQIAVEKFGQADEARGPEKPYQTPFNDEQLENIYRVFSNLSGPEPEKLRELMTEFGVSTKDIQVAADKFYGKQIPGMHNDFSPQQTSQILDYLFADGFGGHVLSKDAPALREPTVEERRYIEFRRANIEAGDYGFMTLMDKVMNPQAEKGPITQAELDRAISVKDYGGGRPWDRPDWRAALDQQIADKKAYFEMLKQQAAESTADFAIGGS
jgi:hypothetical protein